MEISCVSTENSLGDYTYFEALVSCVKSVALQVKDEIESAWQAPAANDGSLGDSNRASLGLPASVRLAGLEVAWHDCICARAAVHHQSINLASNMQYR